MLDRCSYLKLNCLNERTQPALSPIASREWLCSLLLGPLYLANNCSLCRQRREVLSVHGSTVRAPLP